MCANHPADESAPHDAQIGPRYALANLRQPGPLGWKIKRTLANTGIKLWRRQHCCGHAGEPGC
jgi:hypothetical protein